MKTNNCLLILVALFTLGSTTIATAQQVQSGTPIHLPAKLAKANLPNLNPDLNNPRYENGLLIIKIRNTGTVNAPASNATLSYMDNNDVLRRQGVNTPSIPAGGFVEIKFKHPYTHCEYFCTVRVDTANAIREASETDNFGYICNNID